MNKEYQHIKSYFNNLTQTQKHEVLFDLKQLKGLVIDEIYIPNLEDFLVNNIVLILNHLDLLLENDSEHLKSELILLQKLIRKDIIALQNENSNEITYGSKRTFGEYMNYIYNVVEFIIQNKE